MENNNMHSEMDELRRQMQAFKAQLDRQTIVNDQFIFDSMKKKMSWIRRYTYFQFLVLPVVALIWLGIREDLGLSWANYFFMLLMCIIDAVCDYRINVSALRDEDFHRGNLLTTATKLARMKRMRSRSLLVGVPTMVVWFVWTGVEAWMHLSSAPDVSGSVWAGCIGFVAGMLIAVPVVGYIYRKMQRTNDALISQIRQLTAENQ